MILAAGLLVSCFLLALAMLGFEELGRVIALRRLAKDPAKALEGTGVIEGGMFAIWGLLLAFTFSGSASRFETRRHLVSEEANHIGTAYLRLDLLSEKDREPLKELFRQYLDTRLETYQNAEHEPKWRAAYTRSVDLQNAIWKAARESTAKLSQVDGSMLLLPALNNMIDITTTRLVATQMHPPSIVYLLLIVMSLICSALIGFCQSTSSRSWLHIGGFIIVTSFVIYVTLDMEFPRAGLIKVDSVDKVLIDLRESMK